MGVIDVPKGHIGNAEAIFEAIKTQKPKEIKKIDSITSKGSVSEFSKAIALKDKPVINFITK